MGRRSKWMSCHDVTRDAPRGATLSRHAWNVVAQNWLRMIIDPAVVTAFFLLWLVIVPTPGANSLLVIHLAIVDRPSRVAIAILGNVCGFVVLGTAALVGWNAAIEALPGLKTIVRVAGAAYLVWFGWQLWRKGQVASKTPGVIDRTQVSRDARSMTDTPTLGHAFWIGLLTSLSNVQAIVFITSLFAVAGVYDAPVTTGIACIAVMVVTNATYLGGIAGLLQLGPARRWYRANQALMHKVIGLAFVVIGARLVWAAIDAARCNASVHDASA